MLYYLLRKLSRPIELLVVTAIEKTRLPLNRERVLRAAVDLADRGGIEAVSMRRLAQELGVEAMSLYNHVANKEEILDGIVDLVVAEIPPATSGGWKAVLRARILAARQVLLRHAWASRVIETRKNVTPAVVGYLDSMLGILRSGGFSVDLTHHAVHALGSRMFGFAQELYDDSQALAESPEVAAVMLRQMADVYPHVSEMALAVSHDEESTVGTGCDDQFEFEFALDLLLDGLDRLRRANSKA
jgi:AcrR family transcriptional regulator